MRYVTISHLETGMVSGDTIQDGYGRILIERGTVLTDTYIYRLRTQGIQGVYVEDEMFGDVIIDKLISQKVKQQALDAVEKVDPDLCKAASMEMVSEIIAKKKVSLDLVDIRAAGDAIYSHSVNVATLCGVIGKGMKLSAGQLVELTIAALMHDVGKMFIPQEILNKPGRLSKKEYNIMKSHAEKSYEKVKDRVDFSEDMKQAILHHHENVDGSGYPDGQTGDEQNLFTKIIHVADVYDALVSKRPFKEAFSPYEVSEYLMGGCGIMFDQEVVDTLLHYVPLYPKGTEVLLSTGKHAVIIENEGIHNLRPVVRLLNGEQIDLANRENLSLSIQNAGEKTDISLMENEKGRKEMANSKRIFLVDDMKTNLAMLSEILENDYDIQCFSSGEAVLDAIVEKKKRADLILLDIEMSGMDGIETARRILEYGKEVHRSIPILFVSTRGDRDTIINCRKLQVGGYVLRPYNNVYIRSEIQRVLEGWTP